MLFNSYTFIILFLPLCLLGFYALLRTGRNRAVVGWLVLCSLFFYGYDELRFLLAGSFRFNEVHGQSIMALILFSVLFNYGVGRLLAQDRPGRRAILIMGILVDLALLGYFKYAGFAVRLGNALFGANSAIPEIYLPLGISFYTFEQIMYLADVYRDKRGEKNLLSYFLFVTFLPKLIAGPIVHHKEFLPQVAQFNAKRDMVRSFAIGGTMFVLGLAKKVLIADSIAPYASRLFGDTAHGLTPGLLEAWAGVLAYTMQIYFDFSGYSDMAIGIGRMFGIRIAINFHSPYKATSIIDFWRRWHITLSRFLRDYIYIPLGGNRKGKTRRYANLLITMLLGGFWHGANWTYMLWGLMHGLFLVINHAWEAIKKHYGLRARSPRGLVVAMWAGRLITFVAVVFAWVLFKAGEFSPQVAERMAVPRHDVQIAWQVVRGMCGLNGLWSVGNHFSNAVFKPGEQFLYILPLLLGVWLLPNTHQLMYRFRAGLAWNIHDLRDQQHLPLVRQWRWTPRPAWAFATAILFAVCVVYMSRMSEFIYWQF